MSQYAFSLIAGTLFLLIALGHAIRVLFDVTFVVRGMSVPMWASGLAVAIAGYLAYEGFRLAVKSHAGR